MDLVTQERYDVWFLFFFHFFCYFLKKYTLTSDTDYVMMIQFNFLNDLRVMGAFYANPIIKIELIYVIDRCDTVIIAILNQNFLSLIWKITLETVKMKNSRKQKPKKTKEIQFSNNQSNDGVRVSISGGNILIFTDRQQLKSSYFGNYSANCTPRSRLNFVVRTINVWVVAMRVELVAAQPLRNDA